MRAVDVMTTDVITVDPDTTVQALATLLAERGISGAPVVDSGGRAPCRYHQRGRFAAPGGNRHRTPPSRAPPLLVARPFRLPPRPGVRQIAWPYRQGYHDAQCRDGHGGNRSCRRRGVARGEAY